MNSNEAAHLKQLLSRPSERLDLELKEWISPQDDEGRIKLAKACIAMRNNNGGYVAIGFSNDGNRTPPPPNFDIRSLFTIDEVQSIVGEFCSEQFPIDLTFVEFEDIAYPLITVPPGVRTPAACKTTRYEPGNGRMRIGDNVVYVRSFDSSNCVSSAPAKRGDWDRLIQTCIDNREADIGRFVRRHLVGLTPDKLVEALGPLITQTVAATPDQRLLREAAVLRDRLTARASQRGVSLPCPGYRESVVIFEPSESRTLPNQRELAAILASAPSLSGWPPWVHIWGAASKEYHPKVVGGAWEAFLDDDFWRIDHRGVLYQYRTFEDDREMRSNGPQKGTVLDFQLQISYTTEIISSALAIVNALGCGTKGPLLFGFFWHGLQGRILDSWVDPSRTLFSTDAAEETSCFTHAVVPIDLPAGSISPIVERVANELFLQFGGMSIAASVIEGIVMKTLARRM